MAATLRTFGIEDQLTAELPNAPVTISAVPEPSAADCCWRSWRGWVGCAHGESAERARIASDS